MNELSTLNNLVNEIKFFEKQSVLGIWEIGKRLTQIKKMLGHGNWSDWVKDNLNYSQDTAINYINLYKDYPNFEALPNLKTSQLFLLGSVDEETKKEILENEDLEDKTYKETETIIKKYKNLEKKNKELEENNKKLEQEKKILEHQNELLTDENSKKEIVTETIETVKEVTPSDYEAIKRENKRLQDINKKLELDLRISKLNDDEETEKIKSEVRNYKWLVINFVKNTTPLLNLVEQIKLLPKEEQDLMMKSTQNLLGFSNNLYKKMREIYK